MQFSQRSFASYVGIGMFYVMLSIDIFAISVDSGTVLQRCDVIFGVNNFIDDALCFGSFWFKCIIDLYSLLLV